MRAVLLLAALALARPALGYDANGVALGAGEPEVKKAFPSARCKPLEWKTDAADRRCDDGQTSFGGVRAKVTFYLKAGAIEAFDVRFDSGDLELVKRHLRARYGKPLAEATESIARREGEDRKVFKMRWERNAERAVLTAPLGRKRASLEVSRGSFPDEVYRVR